MLGYREILNRITSLEEKFAKLEERQTRLEEEMRDTRRALSELEKTMPPLISAGRISLSREEAGVRVESIDFSEFLREVFNMADKVKLKTLGLLHMASCFLYMKRSSCHSIGHS